MPILIEAARLMHSPQPLHEPSRAPEPVPAGPRLRPERDLEAPEVANYGSELIDALTEATSSWRRGPDLLRMPAPDVAGADRYRGNGMGGARLTALDDTHSKSYVPCYEACYPALNPLLGLPGRRRSGCWILSPRHWVSCSHRPGAGWTRVLPVPSSHVVWSCHPQE